MCYDGFNYYEIVFIYFDYNCSVSHIASEVIGYINSYYKTKDVSIKEPEMYIGASICKLQTIDGLEVWYSYPCVYVNKYVNTNETLFKEGGKVCTLNRNVKNMFLSSYKP